MACYHPTFAALVVRFSLPLVNFDAIRFCLRLVNTVSREVPVPTPCLSYDRIRWSFSTNSDKRENVFMFGQINRISARFMQLISTATLIQDDCLTGTSSCVFYSIGPSITHMRVILISRQRTVVHHIVLIETADKKMHQHIKLMIDRFESHLEHLVTTHRCE